jgi:ribosomal-protein-alanine N-acetyltransferase
MVTRTRRITRPATPGDLQKLANLIHFDAYVHRHLDYRPPLDWVGYYPFPILESHGQLAAALACPPDPPKVAWIRLFAASAQISAEEAWETLWGDAFEQLAADGRVEWAAAIPMGRWFEALLEKSGFAQTHEIVMLNWENRLSHPATDKQVTRKTAAAIIRPMRREDLRAVQVIDEEAFVPVWQNSLAYLEIAFGQAAVATVAETARRLVGYQISTPTPLGGHLARLAVLPEFQGQGIGYALVQDLLDEFSRRRADSVTVNTQKNNLASLAIYRKAGFSLTGEEYPIYQLAMNDSGLGMR